MRRLCGRGIVCRNAGGASAYWSSSCSPAQASCTRKYYRRSADAEVDTVIGDKDCYDAWKVEEFHVYPDPRARFADPSNPDRPPMPPDDPAAHCLSPNPQRPGKAGIGNWIGTGYLELLEAWNAENRARASGQPSAQEASIPGLISVTKREDDSRR